MMEKISEVFEYNTEALHVSLIKVWPRYRIGKCSAILPTKTIRLLGSSQELHKSAEEAANAYEYDPNLVLKNVNYTNVNAMGRLMNLTEYSHHFKQNVYNETSGVQIPIEIYEGCKNICFFFLLVHILTFILFPYS